MLKATTQLLAALLFCSLFLSGCWIKAVNQPGGGNNNNPDTTAIFKDVSSSKLPSDELNGTSSAARAADIDGDGDLDLVVAIKNGPNKILINDGHGNFIDESTRRLPNDNQQNPNTTDVVVADFNNDGYPDLFFTSQNNGGSEYFLNNGDGTFKNVSNRIPSVGNSNTAVAVDVNNDGSKDLVIGNNGPNVILINNGHGFFTDQTGARMPQVNGITEDIETGDINQNGNPDLLIANEKGNRILINTGKGYFIDDSQSRLPPNESIEETRDAALGDVNGDGSLDIYFANVILSQSGNSARDQLLINHQGRFTDVTNSQLPTDNINTTDADFVDIDHDGDNDIVAGGYDSQTNPTGSYSGNNIARVLINNGSGYFSDKTQTYFPKDFAPPATDFVVADFNGDGLDDIYVANYKHRDVLLIHRKK